MTLAGHETAISQISFIPVEGLPKNGASYAYTDSGGNIISVHNKQLLGFRNMSSEIRIWNGLFGTSYPLFSSSQFITGDKNRMSVCKHKGSLYFGGSFVNSDSSTAGVMRWDGQKWECPAGGIYSNYLIHPEISVNHMISFEGKLFVGGQFNRANKRDVRNLVYLENDSWKSVSNVSQRINHFLVLRDTMYVAGNFTEINGTSANGLAACHNAKWFAVNTPGTQEILGLAVSNGKLLIISPGATYIRQGSSWQQVNNLTCKKFNSSCEYRNELYLSGVFEDAQNKESVLVRYSGTSWENIIPLTAVQNPGNANYYINSNINALYFSGSMTALFGKPCRNMVQLYPKHTILSGVVFEDANGNCALDAGELPVPDCLISVNNGSYYISTDEKGKYSIALKPSETADISVYPPPGLISSCYNDPIRIICGSDDSSAELNFGLSQNPLPPAGELIFVSPGAHKARHGYRNYYQIKYTDPAGRYPTEIYLKHPEGLSDFQSNLEPGTLNAENIHWTIYKDQEINFSFVVSPSDFESGDSIRLDVISQSSVDAEVKSVKELEQVIVSAFDPNDKQCNAYQLRTDQRELLYQIRFQNLGSDSAVEIHVVDTISRTLPMQYIQMLAYSHPDKKHVGFSVRDHAIIWRFSNIFLPPLSSAGEEASSGFIQFRAGLQNILQLGDSITNRADIYFDFQDAVRTNLVLSTVTEQVSPKPALRPGISIYPNPADDYFTISFSPYSIEGISIYALSGQIIFDKSFNQALSEYRINCEGLSPGIYIVRIKHPLGFSSAKLVVTK